MSASDAAKHLRESFATTKRAVLEDVLDGNRSPKSALHTLELQQRAFQRRFLLKYPNRNTAWSTFGPPLEMPEIRRALAAGPNSPPWRALMDRVSTARKERTNVRT